MVVMTMRTPGMGLLLVWLQMTGKRTMVRTMEGTQQLPFWLVTLLFLISVETFMIAMHRLN